MLYPDINLQKRTQQNTTRYRTALYLRLSREDGDKTESDSIANQRTLLEVYAADHPELCIVDEFVDDGYSGSNFERPAITTLPDFVLSFAKRAIIKPIVPVPMITTF